MDTDTGQWLSTQIEAIGIACNTVCVYLFIIGRADQCPVTRGWVWCLNQQQLLSIIVAKLACASPSHGSDLGGSEGGGEGKAVRGSRRAGETEQFIGDAKPNAEAAWSSRVQYQIPWPAVWNSVARHPALRRLRGEAVAEATQPGPLHPQS